MICDIRALLAQEQLTLFAPIPLEACRVLRPYLLARCGIRTGTVIMLAVPYGAPTETHNVSAYAIARDYHMYFQALFDRILPRLREKYPAHRFAGFADHAPIDEIHAAACAGLGVIGDNGLLLTEPYSSYIFLGEIVTDAALPAAVHDIATCEHCGACRRACPVGLDKSACLSALTQKKGELTAQERARLAAHPLVWGCDTCQQVCPHTLAAARRGTLYDAVPFFRERRIPQLCATQLEAMDEDTFAARAYAWRGRAVIARNLALHEECSDT